MLLAQMFGARKVLEIGTLGGFSTIWLARGLPADGTVDTCEFELDHAGVARRNFAHAGVWYQVRIHVGAALDTLPTLTGPYDLLFIDADKANNLAYLEWAVKLSRPGSVIVLDNTVRGGEVRNDDESIAGTQRALEVLGTHLQLAGPRCRP